MGKTYPYLLISRFEHAYDGRSVEGNDTMPYVCIGDIEVLTGPAAPHIVVSSVTRQSGILILFTANIGFLRLVRRLSLLSYIDINRVDAGSR